MNQNKASKSLTNSVVVIVHSRSVTRNENEDVKWDFYQNWDVSVKVHLPSPGQFQHIYAIIAILYKTLSKIIILYINNRH